MKRAVGAFAAMMMVSVGICPLAGYAEQGDPDEVVASVDGVKCLRKDMELFVANILASQNVPAAQQAEARKHFEKSFVNSFVMRTLLCNEAAKAGVTVTDEDRKAQEERLDAVFKSMNKTREQYFKESPFGEETARKEFEKTMLVEKLIQMKVTALVEVDAAEVEKTIEAIKASNAALEADAKDAAGAKAAKRAKIEDIKKQLAAGADFAALAKEHSDCPSGQRSGGDLGTFQRGQMVKPFEDAAFTQEVGKVGDIVETPFGYHLILVTAKNPAVAADGAVPAKPETVAASHILVKTGNPQQAVQPVPTADEIRERLKQQKAQPATRAYLNELKGKAKIESVIPIDPF